MKAPTTKYAEQFKQKAIDLAARLKNCSLAARKLNIPEGTLQKWTRKAKQNTNDQKQNTNDQDPQLSLAIRTSGELAEKLDFYADLLDEFRSELKRFEEECEEIINKYVTGEN